MLLLLLLLLPTLCCSCRNYRCSFCLRKLIDLRCLIVHCRLQREEELSSQADDPFSGTFVDARSIMQPTSTSTAKLQVLFSSDADAGIESNVIFPPQRHHSARMRGAGLHNCVSASVLRSAWGEVRAVPPQSDG